MYDRRPRLSSGEARHSPACHCEERGRRERVEGDVAIWRGKTLAFRRKENQLAEYPKPELLAEPDWLAQHLDDPNITIVDARGAPRYAEGHIKNAVNLPVARLD